MSTVLTSEQKVAKRYYHKSSNFRFYVEPSRRVVQDGVSTVVDGRSVQFSGTVGDYGAFMTDDPTLIEILEERKDVLNEAQYLDATTPVDRKLQTASRTITEQNQLIAKLQKDLAAKQQR
ncbi:MAG: hypothetical protein GY906_22475 [bacterium]|nr:hypothetical protein [bacterium]